MNDLELLQAEMAAIEKQLIESVSCRNKLLAPLHPSQQMSAANLIQYLSLPSGCPQLFLTHKRQSSGLVLVQVLF